MFDMRDHGGHFGGGGSSGELNIYTQLTEPTKKEGIWVKTDQKYSKVINDLELWFAEQWNDTSLKTFADMPEAINYFSSCKVGSKIYLAGGSASTTETSTNIAPFYCYDTVEDSWSKLADIPIGRVSASLDYYNGKLYFIGGFANGSYGSSNTYCYDIANNAWSSLAMMPYSKARHGSCVFRDKIICIGGYNSAIQSTVCMYDITNNTWTNLKNCPVGIQNFVCEEVNGFIYCLSGSGQNSTVGNYKYDILNDTWISLDSTQYVQAFYPDGAVVGTDIYVYGGRANATSVFYVYHTDTDEKEEIPNAPMYESNNKAKLEFIDGSIYAFGFSGNTLRKIVRAYSFNSKVFDDRALILYRIKSDRGTYQTEFLTSKPKAITGLNLRFTSYFDNVYMYLNNSLQENLETYYGDGTQWVKFKGGV